MLTFDSNYLLSTFEKIYNYYAAKLVKIPKCDRKNLLLIFRKGSENHFLLHQDNLSAKPTKLTHDQIDLLSVEFYNHLKYKIGNDRLKIENYTLYDLYPRQVKLKLRYILILALRIKNISENERYKLKVLSDAQTISITREAFKFVDGKDCELEWDIDRKLTYIVLLNSIIIRFFSVLYWTINSSKLPTHYFKSKNGSNKPSIFYILPKNSSKILYESYVRKLENSFQFILYSEGFIPEGIPGYTRNQIKINRKKIRGYVNAFKDILTAKGYVYDIILTYRKHCDLPVIMNIADAIYENNIDLHLSKQQTNALELCAAIKAIDGNVPVVADVMEEVYRADYIICPTEDDFQGGVQLAISEKRNVAFKGSNSLIQYRMASTSGFDVQDLRELLGLGADTKLILYASDPSKEELQRLNTEHFLISAFAKIPATHLVIKTHPEDAGRISDTAFTLSKRPENVTLIGDLSRRTSMYSNNFKTYQEISFHTMLSSSDFFITSSSSSLLEAILLGVKSGVVDIYGDGYFQSLIDSNAVQKISCQRDIHTFLTESYKEVPEHVLRKHGLITDVPDFNLQSYMLSILTKVE